MQCLSRWKFHPTDGQKIFAGYQRWYIKYHPWYDIWCTRSTLDIVVSFANYSVYNLFCLCNVNLSSIGYSSNTIRLDCVVLIQNLEYRSVTDLFEVRPTDSCTVWYYSFGYCQVAFEFSKSFYFLGNHSSSISSSDDLVHSIVVRPEGERESSGNHYTMNFIDRLASFKLHARKHARQNWPPSLSAKSSHLAKSIMTYHRTIRMMPIEIPSKIQKHQTWINSN